MKDDNASIKRLQSYLIAILTTLAMLTLCIIPIQPAIADDGTGSGVGANQGVSSTMPDESNAMTITGKTTRDSVPPPIGSVWTTKYYFSGTSYTGGDLYTNYWFTGRSTYFISVTNTGTNTMKVAGWKNPQHLVSEVTVRPGETYNYFIRGLGTRDKILLQFRAASMWQPFSFSGYIE